MSNNTTSNPTDYEVGECHKCMLLREFIEKSCESKIKFGVLLSSLELLYNCCGKNSEKLYRGYLLQVFENYEHSLQKSYFSFDNEGLLECMKLGECLNYISQKDFDVWGLFGLNTNYVNIE